MVRDCKKWRRCKDRARRIDQYSGQQAIWTIIAVYNYETTERMDKSTLVEMVHELMLENGLEARRLDADLAVESWYQEGLV